MMKKAFAISAAAIFASAVMFACSSSSSNTGNTAASCPAVGYKACPNDPAATQSDVDTCNKCLSQTQAVDTCAANNGITVSTTPTCGSDGTSQPAQLTQDQTNTLLSKCSDQLNAYSSCASGSTGDAG